MRAFGIFVTKDLGFFEKLIVYAAPTDNWGWGLRQCGHLSREGRGQFSIL